METAVVIFQDKKLLVTGGTGSFGKVFVRRVLTGEAGMPRKVVILSRDEAKQNDMRIAFLHAKGATDDVIYRNFQNVLEFRIGDVRDYGDVCAALRDADVVINAAALKQVPSCEYFPWQAIQTNCLGAENIVRGIREHGFPIQTVLGVSTDKACKPVNVMGMTKSLQERIFIAANVLNPATRFLCVRYGNVLASRGSVIPLFHEQIRRNGPVTVTVPDMTRFLLSLDQAVDTVYAAIGTGLRGETYVPNAPAATVMSIAKALVGERKIPIEITGIRPGEKMHEIMLSEEEAPRSVRRGDFYAIRPMLPELQDPASSEPAAFTTEFSSSTAPLDLAGTRELLARNRLMPGDESLALDGELLR